MNHEHTAVPDTHETDMQPSPPWTFRAMALHFLLVGAGLFVAAVGLFYLTYQDLSRIDLGLSLRITDPGDIYERDTQLLLAGALIVSAVSLLPLRAMNSLNRRHQNAITRARLAALLLLAGIPLAGGLWLYMDRIPASREDMSTAQQLIDEVSLIVYLFIALLLIQSVLAVWYQFWLSSASARQLLNVKQPVQQVLWQRLRAVGLVVWVLLLVGLGIGLGIATDWLYELPVDRPAPDEFLYTTTFDAFNDEWDMYQGRDRAEIMNSADTNTDQLAGEALAIEYGTGLSEGLVWSSLDRKFNDFDLRVTTQVVAGPDEESMYGIMFRYKDKDNFYLFRISGDGYYSLRKVTDGLIEDVSVWNYSDVIHQGQTANEIQIIADDDAFRFFVNGQQMPLCLKGANLHSMWAGPDSCVEGGELTTVYRDAAFAQGKIALFAGSVYGTEVSVAFDDVLIVGPNPQVWIAE